MAATSSNPKGLELSHASFAATKGWMYLESTNGLVLDVDQPDSSKPVGTGAKVQLWANLGRDNQKFRFVEVKPGFYCIEVKAGGLVLDIDSPDVDTDGGRVQVWSRSGAPNQFFAVQDNSGDLFQLITHAGKSVDVDSTDYKACKNGARVQTWTPTGSPWQCFRAIPVEHAPSKQKLGWTELPPDSKMKWTKISLPGGGWFYGPPGTLYLRNKRIYAYIDLRPLQSFDWQREGWKILRAAARAGVISGVVALLSSSGLTAAAAAAFAAEFANALQKELGNVPDELLNRAKKCSLYTKVKSHGTWYKA